MNEPGSHGPGSGEGGITPEPARASTEEGTQSDASQVMHSRDKLGLEQAQAAIFQRLNAISRYPEGRTLIEQTDLDNMHPARLRYLEKQIDRIEDEYQNRQLKIDIWQGEGYEGLGHVQFFRSWRSLRRWETSEIGEGYTVTAKKDRHGNAAAWLEKAIVRTGTVKRSDRTESKSFVWNDPDSSTRDFRMSEEVSQGTVFGVPATITRHTREHFSGHCERWEFQFETPGDEQDFLRVLPEIQEKLCDRDLIKQFKEFHEHWKNEKHLSNDKELLAFLAGFNPRWSIANFLERNWLQLETRYVNSYQYGRNLTPEELGSMLESALRGKLSEIPMTRQGLDQFFTDERLFTLLDRGASEWGWNRKDAPILRHNFGPTRKRKRQ